MKSRRKGWPLVFETLISTAAVEALYLWLLFNTRLGDVMPDLFKICAATGIWIITLAFFYSHRTPDGSVEISETTCLTGSRLRIQLLVGLS